MSNTEAIFRNWTDKAIYKKRFIGDSRFSLQAEDYTTRGVDSQSEDTALPNKINFRPDVTRFGIVLQAPRKGRIIDTAVLGFNIDHDVGDCLEIQGGKGRYRELSPIVWYAALIDHFVDLGRESGLIALQIVRAIDVWDPDYGTRALERMLKIYDSGARSHGFEWSAEANRYILDL